MNRYLELGHNMCFNTLTTNGLPKAESCMLEMHEEPSRDVLRMRPEISRGAAKAQGQADVTSPITLGFYPLFHILLSHVFVPVSTPTLLYTF